jgi:hypothetical protein
MRYEDVEDIVKGLLLKHLEAEGALYASKAIALTTITTQERNVQNKLWFY